MQKIVVFLQNYVDFLDNQPENRETMDITSTQRRDMILSEAYENGKALIKPLAERIGVSEATVRRDIKSLADSGKLELIFGGATLPHKSDFSFHSKEMRNVDAKRIVGRLASDFVNDNEIIFMDSGTTCFQMIPFLKSKRNLSVIVNSARLALEFENFSANVIMLGGQYRPDRMDTVGPMTSTAMEQLRGFKCFCGADGLGMDFGMTAGDIESAHIYRQALQNAKERILLVDHTKFLNPSLFKIESFDIIDRVITDLKPSDEWMDFLGRLEIDVYWPEES